MNTNEADAGEGTQNQNSNTCPNTNQSKGFKGKSCKGCLYYSSFDKSKSKNPTCVGFSRTLQQVPSYIIGETELEASKEGRSLTDFKYACVGYSVYLENKDSSADPQDKTAKLPFCVGLEVLLDKSPSTAPVGQVPSHAHKSEDNHTIPQKERYRPTTVHSSGDEYFNRFKRNAVLVASGVARNLNRVGNYIKESLDDILYPYRKK
ncbi:Altered inheritance of mitochondria 23, mitochondrial [Quillaja saponaria]|uniref:Altered inheritance of mitochondria 23, mitochondrial n=1 Tax=Quillaja saponaria TaxID=32244 RepID=A0AAD7LZV8_QUISA|nr:Altered inheritance of mitochondria 23, mitochondrial [Quillaja saponaria]